MGPLKYNFKKSAMTGALPVRAYGKIEFPLWQLARGSALLEGGWRLDRPHDAAGAGVDDRCALVFDNASPARVNVATHNQLRAREFD